MPVHNRHLIRFVALVLIVTGFEFPIKASENPPQTQPPAKSSRRLALDVGSWFVIFGSTALAGIAVTTVVMARHNRGELRDLRSTANASNGAALTQTVTYAMILSSSILQNQMLLLQVNTIGSQAQSALAVAGAPQGSAMAQSIVSQSNTAGGQNAALLQQVQAFQAAVASSGTVTPQQQQQLSNLLVQSEMLRSQANALVSQLNQLLARFANVPSVPPPIIAPVPGPVPASASMPTY